MKDFETITVEIMRAMAEDGTPVTREEAEEMAKMELNAKSMKRYESSGKKHQKKQVVRKIDKDKFFLMKLLTNALEDENILINSQKNEAEFSFNFNNSDYTVKLIKHRPKKK